MDKKYRDILIRLFNITFNIFHYSNLTLPSDVYDDIDKALEDMQYEIAELGGDNK